MNHCPYEDWLLEENLSAIKEKELRAHLNQCYSCRELKEAIAETDHLFSNLPLSTPEPGFTDRWVKLATKKEEERQKRWVWLLLGGLVLSAGISFTVLQLPVIYSGLSISQILTGFVLRTINSVENIYSFVQSYRFILDVVPIHIPTYVWIGVSMNIVFWVAVWSFSLWKVVRPRGVTQ